MELSDAFAWLEAGALGRLGIDTSWAFVTAETLHFMGLSLLLGALAVLELRILGVLSRVDVHRLFPLIPIALFGFALNLVSGVVMFASDPLHYWPNPWFKLKLVLIAAAGLNALWFWRVEHPKLQALAARETVGASARGIASLSLALWLGVLVLGRLLPYVWDSGG